MQQPFFSIITPVYNCKKFLKKCIESVLNQTYTSWELILVDDGSTDSSGIICDNYCYDERIRVIHQNNMGQLVSRINGMAAARGVYELGLDADDYLDKRCLETIKKAVDASGSDMIFFGYRNVGKTIGCVRCMLETEREYSQKEILKEIIDKTNHSLCNKAIKVNKAKRVKYSEIKKRLDINEDYVQIVSILCEIDTAYVIDDVLYNYRVYENSISHSYKVKHILDTEWATRYVIRRLKENSLIDKEMYYVIYLSYLKMIAPRLSGLFCNKDISRKDCRNIHKSHIYQNSKKMELPENFNKHDFMILKLFRYRLYDILRLYVKLLGQ